MTRNCYGLQYMHCSKIIYGLGYLESVLKTYFDCHFPAFNCKVQACPATPTLLYAAFYVTRTIPTPSLSAVRIFTSTNIHIDYV